MGHTDTSKKGRDQYGKATFKHYQPDIILLTVRWYLRYNLSFRNVVEMRLIDGSHNDYELGSSI